MLACSQGGALSDYPVAQGDRFRLVIQLFMNKQNRKYSIRNLTRKKGGKQWLPLV